jgi:tetratricopeptide (TPR) repeat protein
MTAKDAILDFRRRLLRFDAGAEAILPAAALFPEAAMVQICAAVFHLYGQTGENNRQADGFLNRAENCGAATKHPSLLRALRLWHNRDYEEAAGILEEMTLRNPEDLMAAKLAEFLYYIMGQQHCGPRFLAHMQRLEASNSGDPDFLAMHSFARELCGDFAHARDLAEKSLEIEARNPWAEHTLSHVTLRLGDIKKGELRLQKFLPVAATCSRPIHSHTAWHLALFALERQDHPAALAVFKQHVWGITPDLVSEQIDAISLLWRMEMMGADVSAEWSDIADHVEARVSECYMPFLSAHHTYALTRAERGEALKRLQKTVRAQSEDPLWSKVGSPVVLASSAFARGNWREVTKLLDPVMPRMTSIGGSDAQDDLFRQMYFVALAGTRRKVEARTFWERFTAAKRESPLDGWFLGMV